MSTRPGPLRLSLLGDLVEVTILVLEVVEEVVSLEGLPELLHQEGVHRTGHAPLVVHLAAQPLPQRPKLAALDEAVDAARGAVHRKDLRVPPQVKVELGGHHRPEEVGREVAHGEAGPVHVLEAPERVRGHLVDAEQLAHPLVPGLRQVPHLQVPGEDLGLEAVAQHHVHRVGELVRLHPNQAPRDPVARAVQSRVRRPGFFLLGEAEVAPRQGPAPAPKRLGEADVALPEEALRLVDAHTERGVHG
mmetsp:Transcript_4543/g.10689  ORF Transcript_4543/g.10689 Transcript_4543/m.10689 type:complete len:247 (-) Transcript_4543:1018-1758(-)